jgi:hypothetical protein
MSSQTSCNVGSSRHPEAVKVDRQEARKSSRIHDWVEAVRDTAIVVAFQMILRATLMMRRWNY